MKNFKILFTLLISILSFQCYCQNTNNNKSKNDLIRLKLKGKVKTLTELEYSSVMDSGKSAKGKLISSKKRLFNSDGNLLETSCKMSNEKYSYKYTCKYNKKGKMVEESLFDNIGNFSGKICFVYNNKAQITQQNEYNAQNKLIKKCDYKYDKKGNQIEMLISKTEFSDSRYIFEYDDKGNETEYKIFKSDSLFQKVVKTYDDNLNLTLESYSDFNGKFTGKIVYQYDSNGNEISRIPFNSDGKKSFVNTYLYNKIDKSGNWINKTEFFNRKPKVIFEREITYY